MRFCLLIPHYNHHEQLERFLPSVMAHDLPCVIVDDGSRPESVAHLQRILPQYPKVTLLTMPRNRGKGRAVKTGICWATMNGFTHAIQIDADGQHDVQDIPRFIEEAQKYPDAIISGQPSFDKSAPAARRHGRKVTTFICALETFSFAIRDGLCGFRAYSLAAFEKIEDAFYIGNRMDADTEILVKAIWAGVPVRFIPTAVIYPENNISHFQYLRDNLLLIKVHSRLLLSAPWNLCAMWWRRFKN
ncbi:glycosyltransferase family 2 protein [Saccharophagus sp. K07]|jgi:glycosyltransferase involved in cell wall biosynthesis|uniref:glycosyltransferase family 2 protein n=1 Tax=Saccharophagus sp. K07 TaxID=2283636 RepID=UPI001651E4EB|nr:glycosyltransferase family 2 protein [Saccharophagus sp. K07]MBC6906703.1 glycosyltransferase family 2 protein [Saccharophagus sp. K07]